MKLYKDIEKKYSPEEIAESFIFPDDQTPAEREASLNSFKEWRSKKEKSRTKEEKSAIDILRLKYLMIDYIKDNTYKKEIDFGFFVNEYINILEIKKKDFAREIDIDPTELSQIINKHRAPNERFMIRLEIHSNKNLPAIIWFNIFQKERSFELLHNDKLRISEGKHVKARLKFTV